MPEKKTLTQQIEMVNAQLRDFGRAAIQKVKMVKLRTVRLLVRSATAISHSMFLMR